MRTEKIVKSIAVALLATFALSVTGCATGGAANAKNREPMTQQQREELREEYRNLQDLNL